jgi:hypothetical protein
VTLVEIGGNKIVVSGNRLIDGVASDDERKDDIMHCVVSQAFGHEPVLTEPPEG